DKHLGKWDAVIARERGNRLAAFVHVALRQRQPEITAVGCAAASHQTREPCFGSKLERQSTRDPLHEPGAGVVTRDSVAAPGIAEADEEAQWNSHGEKKSGVKGSNKKARRHPTRRAFCRIRRALFLLFLLAAAIATLFGTLLRAFLASFF